MTADERPQELQRRMVAFVRAFGLHRPDETPCGARVAVSEAHALTVLSESGAISQVDLGQHLNLTKSTISRLVDQLEQRGWAARHSGPDDARCRLVKLTTEGRATADHVAQLRSERMTRLLDRIPEDERPAILAALDALVEAARDD